MCVYTLAKTVVTTIDVPVLYLVIGTVAAVLALPLVAFLAFLLYLGCSQVWEESCRIGGYIAHPRQGWRYLRARRRGRHAGNGT